MHRIRRKQDEKPILFQSIVELKWNKKSIVSSTVMMRRSNFKTLTSRTLIRFAGCVHWPISSALKMLFWKNQFDEIVWWKMEESIMKNRIPCRAYLYEWKNQWAIDFYIVIYQWEDISRDSIQEHSHRYLQSSSSRHHSSNSIMPIVDEKMLEWNE